MRFDLNLSSKAVSGRDLPGKPGYFIDIKALAIDKAITVTDYRSVLSTRCNSTLRNGDIFHGARDTFLRIIIKLRLSTISD